MAKLKDQCDRIKRAITMMEQDVNECMLLAEYENDSAYVVRSSALKGSVMKVKKNLQLLEKQYSALAEKKRSYNHLFIYLIKYRIFYTQLFLHFSFLSLLSTMVVDKCFLSIRYFTEIMITVIVIMLSVEHMIY